MSDLDTYVAAGGEFDPILPGGALRDAISLKLPHSLPSDDAHARRGVAIGSVFITVLATPLLLLLVAKIEHVVGSGHLIGIYGTVVTAVILSALSISFLLYRDPARAAVESGVLTGRDPAALPLVSVLVAVRNEERLIDQCVRSIVATTYARREILVVDDGSTDGTAAILAGLATAIPELSVISLPSSVGKKRALAQAVDRARGRYFVFTDSDSILDARSIEYAVAAFEHDARIGAISGHARALNSERNLLTKTQDAWYDGQFGVWKATESVFGAVTCVSGPFAAFRREAIVHFIPAWVEDRFLGIEFPFATDRQLTGYVLGSRQVGPKLMARYHADGLASGERAQLRDWRVVYSRSIRVWTEVPDTFRRLVRQQIRWKKSFIRNLFFTGSFYWRKPLPAAAIFYARASFRIVGPLVAANELIRVARDGDIRSAVLYVTGILLVGSAMGAAYKIQNPTSHRWIYRPLMSLMNTCLLCWLIAWSAATIWRPTWSRS